MKKVISILTLLFLLGRSHPVIAQDPYARLQEAASRHPAAKTLLKPQKVTTTDPRWKLYKLPAIPFKPFPMIDKAGKPIKPTDVVTLKNGNKMTAQEFFPKLNDLEQKLNQQGYSLRNNKAVTTSKMELSRVYYDDKLKTLPKAIKPLRSAEEKIKAGSLQVTIGGVVLKPDSKYTPAERKEIEGVVFTGSGAVSNVSAKKTAASPAPVSARPTLGYSPTLLKAINETETRDWEVGDPSIMAAGFKGVVTREAEIYAFDPQRPGACMSQFRFTATGTVTGNILNNSFDIFTTKADFFAPHDSTRPMTASFDIKGGGLSLYNFQESIPQEKSYVDFQGYQVLNECSIDVPICTGIDFIGTVGVKGNAGLDYNIKIGRGYLVAQISPVVSITGFAQAGADIGGIVDLGVEADLDFLTANLDMDGEFYIGPLNNPASVCFFYEHYFGFDIKMLDGKISCFANVCTPWVDICYNLFTCDLFSFSGASESGTISDDTQVFTLANL